MRSVILAGKRDSRRHFTTSFCENGVVAKTSPRNVGDLVFLESRKGLAIIIQKQLRQVSRSQRISKAPVSQLVKAEVNSGKV